MIIPRVKSETRSKQIATFSLPLKVFCADAPSTDLLAVWLEFRPDLPLLLCDARAEADVILSVQPNCSRFDEFYSLSVTESSVTVIFKDYLGGRNALATLSQLFVVADGAVTCPVLRISDWPDSSFRALMLDPARRFIPVPDLKRCILRMAMCKMTKLRLHLSDAGGYCLRSEAYPDFPSQDGLYYSVEEMKEVIAYAATLGVDIIPEFDIPAHARVLLQYAPHLSCEVEIPENMTNYVACVSNEALYEFLTPIFAELAEIFPYEYIHIGTDEIAMRDTDHFHHWNECPRCQAFCRENGIENETELFYYFLRRMYGIITSLGKKMMMWNDNIDISKSPELPRDILIEFWRVAGKNRGPREGCSMARFLEEGFTVVNADYPNTYIDLYIRWEKLRTWNPVIAPADLPEAAHQILGGDMCAWGDTRPNINYYDFIFLAALPAFADRTWKHAPVLDDKQFELGLTRHILGQSVPEDFNLFDTVNGIIITYKDLTFFRPDADLAAFQGVLDGITPENELQREALAVYGKYVKNA